MCRINVRTLSYTVPSNAHLHELRFHHFSHDHDKLLYLFPIILLQFAAGETSYCQFLEITRRAHASEMLPQAGQLPEKPCPDSARHHPESMGKRGEDPPSVPTKTPTHDLQYRHHLLLRIPSLLIKCWRWSSHFLLRILGRQTSLGWLCEMRAYNAAAELITNVYDFLDPRLEL